MLAHEKNSFSPPGAGVRLDVGSVTGGMAEQQISWHSPRLSPEFGAESL